MSCAAKSAKNGMGEAPKVVLDTNVLVSGLLKSSTTCRQILQSLSRQSFSLVISDAIRDELLEVLDRPKCRPFIDAEAYARLLRVIRLQALLVNPTKLVTDSPDPKDAMVLAAVRDSQASFLVTGDHALLELSSYSGAQVMSPRDFLAWLQKRRQASA